MFSIKIDNDIHKGIDLISIDFLIPHEEVLLDKKEILKNNLKYKDQSVIISSIIVCHESFVIIDGHHRYTALKELGVKKIPVTLINYFNQQTQQLKPKGLNLRHCRLRARTQRRIVCAVDSSKRSTQCQRPVVQEALFWHQV